MVVTTGSVLRWIVWFVLMILVMGWLARSRLRTRTASDPHLLHHPPSTLILGAVVGGLFLALAVLSYVFPNNTGSLGISLFFAGFALLGAVMVAEYFRVNHRLEPGGLQYQKLFGKGGRLRWNDVAQVQYSQSAKWFRIVTIQGETVRVSAMLVGLPEFARAVLEGVRPASIENASRTVLEQTAAGSPPSIWM